MTDQSAKAQAFKDLHIPGNPLLLFNAWDAGSTKAVEKAGARAIATGSWSVAAANGYGDGEEVPLALAMENLARIVAATSLPVSVDIESGYGDAPEAVGQTVRKAVAAGAIGCNLEDSFPADGSLRDAEAQVSRIGAARQAANGLPFFINARTDIFFQKPAPQHDETMLQEAVRRAQLYADAGADGIFVPGLIDLALLEKVCAEVPIPVNFMAFPGAPGAREVALTGVARISHGPNPYRTAMAALTAAAQAAFDWH